MKKSYYSLCLILFFSFLFVGLFAPVVVALNFPSGKEDLYIQNNILFYEPGEETRNLSGGYGYSYTYGSYYGCGEGTGNKNYKGDTVWSNSDLNLITQNRPFYEAAANEYSIPWQIIAVIHYQEHSLKRTNPSNGEGIYQLTSYTNKGTNENRFEPTNTAVSDDEFMRQTKLAAKLIKENYAKGLDLSTSDGVKRLFFNYNGHGGEYYKNKAIALGLNPENGEGSPYVMNRYDAQRDPTSSSMNPAWRGIFVGNGVYDATKTDSRFGAYVNFMALVGIYSTNQTVSSESSSTSYSGSNVIAKRAIEISKSGYNSGDTTPTAAYVQALKAAGTYSIESVDSPGASCDVFVATVLRTTIDKNFPKSSGGSEQYQRKYLASHPELYQRIYPNGNIGVLRDGDIMVTGDDDHRHIQIFITLNGQAGLASASHNNRTGQHWAPASSILNITMGTTYYTYDVYRYIGDGVGQGISLGSGQPCTPTTQSPTTASAAPQDSSPYPLDNVVLTTPKVNYTESDFKSNSDKIACPQNTKTVGTYNNGHYNQQQIAVRLCEVPTIKYSGRKYTGKEQQNGHAIANSLAAEAFYAFAADYKTITGKEIVVTQSFRTYEFQDNMYKCVHGTLSNSDFKKIYGITDSDYDCQDSFKGPAQAGNSKHEAGLAMDLKLTSLFNIESYDSYGYDPNTCKTGAFTSSSKTDTGSTWNGKSRWTLKGMELFCELLPKYGLKFTVASEPWHIQYVGQY